LLIVPNTNVFAIKPATMFEIIDTYMLRFIVSFVYGAVLAALFKLPMLLGFAMRVYYARGILLALVAAMLGTYTPQAQRESLQQPAPQYG
jgi:hypothetical protein